MPWLLKPWLQTGNHVYEVDCACSGDAEKGKVWALHKLAKDWSSYDLAIYTDGLVKDGTEIGGGGTLVTTGHPCDPTDNHFYSMPVGTWRPSFQSKKKANKRRCTLSRQKSLPRKYESLANTNQSYS